jgi:hypothetical protein
VPRKVFVSGEILTASDVNTQLMDQTIMTFAGTAARGSAIPSPTEGMTTYLQDSDIVSIYDGSAWKTPLATTGGILQVVSTTKTDTFSSSVSANTFVDVTGLSATITPKSSSSKILVSYMIHMNRGDDNPIGATRIVRDSTGVGVGDSSGNRQRVTSAQIIVASNNAHMFLNQGQFLDSPATTSALTYKIQVNILLDTGSQTMYVNRSELDPDNAGAARPVSTITLMEVAG